MATTMSVAAIVVSLASSAYSAYTANDNAIDARKAADEQKRIADERARAQAAQEAEQARLQNLKLQSRQRAALAGAGVDLNAGDLAKLTTDETAALGQKDQNTIGENLRMRLEDNWLAYKQQTLNLPSTGSIIAGSSLQAASSALSIYSSYNIQNALLNKVKSDNMISSSSLNSTGYSLGVNTKLNY